MSENPVTSLIGQFGPRRVLAVEVGATEAAVHKWALNGRIPTEWQDKVVQAARKRGLRHVTPAYMLRVHNPDHQATGTA
jgi:hypothetical protein